MSVLLLTNQQLWLGGEVFHCSLTGLVTAALMLCLSSCGGGANAAAGSPSLAAGILVSTPATAPTTPPKTLIVDCYGDSTTFGYDGTIGRQVAAPMPDDLQRRLSAKLGEPVIVNNRGVNSTTAADLLTGTNGLAPFASRIVASPADVVVFNFGLNEAYRGDNPQSIHDSLTSLVTLAKAAGKQVIISSPNPINVRDPWKSPLPPLVQTALQVASETGAIVDDEYGYISSLPDWTTLLTDGVHPSQALYSMKADRLADVILLLLHKP